MHDPVLPHRASQHTSSFGTPPAHPNSSSTTLLQGPGRGDSRHFFLVRSRALPFLRIHDNALTIDNTRLKVPARHCQPSRIKPPAVFLATARTSDHKAHSLDDTCPRIPHLALRISRTAASIALTPPACSARKCGSPTLSSPTKPFFILHVLCHCPITLSPGCAVVTAAARVRAFAPPPRKSPGLAAVLISPRCAHSPGASTGGQPVYQYACTPYYPPTQHTPWA